MHSLLTAKTFLSLHSDLLWGTKSPFLLAREMGKSTGKKGIPEKDAYLNNRCVNIEVIKGKLIGWLEEKFMQEPEFFLVEVKIQGRKISVFLDGTHGITIDKCSEFSRYLQRHLDGETLMDDDYLLEVSSPGLDNPFKVHRQYKKAIGKEVSVIKFDGIRLDGVLRDADENKVVLETILSAKGKPVQPKIQEIPFNTIKSTKLKINF